MTAHSPPSRVNPQGAEDPHDPTPGFCDGCPCSSALPACGTILRTILLGTIHSSFFSFFLRRKLECHLHDRRAETDPAEELLGLFVFARSQQDHSRRTLLPESFEEGMTQ